MARAKIHKTGGAIMKLVSTQYTINQCIETLRECLRKLAKVNLLEGYYFKSTSLLNRTNEISLQLAGMIRDLILLLNRLDQRHG